VAGVKSDQTMDREMPRAVKISCIKPQMSRNEHHHSGFAVVFDYSWCIPFT
jgi:hypothetical protein